MTTKKKRSDPRTNLQIQPNFDLDKIYTYKKDLTRGTKYLFIFRQKITFFSNGQ